MLNDGPAFGLHGAILHHDPRLFNLMFIMSPLDRPSHDLTFTFAADPVADMGTETTIDDGHSKCVISFAPNRHPVHLDVRAIIVGVAVLYTNLC